MSAHRATSRWRQPAVRLCLGLALGAGIRLLAHSLQGLPVFALLGLNSVSFVGAAVLFGWPGLVGVALVRAVSIPLRQPSLWYFLLSLAAYSLAGALAYLTFRWLPRLGRGLHDLRSFGALSLATGVGGVLSASVIAASVHGVTFWAESSIWARSTVVSVWLFTPPLLILADRLLRRWMVPIPGEWQRRPPIAGRASVTDSREVPIRVEEAAAGRSGMAAAVATVLVVTAGISVLTVYANREVPELGSWLSVLFLAPIYWAARRQRLAGGLIAAALVAVGYMGGQSYVALSGASAQPLEIYAHVLMFLVVGALLGEAEARELDLRNALAHSNRRLRRDLQRVVQGLTGAVAAKDLYTEGHLQRVSAFAVEVASRLGLSEPERDQIHIASVLHDLGKIGIPEQTLNKAGRLSAEEAQQMHRHPDIGARILADIEGFAEASALVRHHQERYDGQRDGEFPGYPLGLSGEQIPLGARIIAVVDAFDAMTTDRPYRAAMQPPTAVAILRGERGRQFDPRVVDVFLGLLSEKPWAR
jgi:HD-GYP domain-containing protein (c-di-GMP phosphodiesterase class II)